MRFFNGKEVELLAPAGTFDIFKSLLNLPCDAFYFGGKVLNMRMHRKDFNFENHELTEASKMAHDLGKKIYVTVNILHGKEESGLLDKYLEFLAFDVKPDAVIFQDFGLIEKAKPLGLELHSSVMMNVHNYETIKRLEDIGVTRVVMSREVSLNYIKQLSKTTNMEFEYFIHGDMCVTHGAQCLYSGLLFGNSSNRGRCMKPCRWDYAIEADGVLYDTKFPLAVKDMYMYEHIPELIDCGITSFKIEGRMRDAAYLGILVEAYGESINRYIDDPVAYNRKKDAEKLYENRKRDFSTAYAFGTPGLNNINLRYEGTGKFYSTGKVFSVPTEEHSITREKTAEIKEYLNKHKINNAGKLKINVRLNSFYDAKLALGTGVDSVLLSGDTFLPASPFSKQQIMELAQNKQGKKIYLALPKMMNDIDFEEYSHLLKDDLNIDGLVATNLGAVNKFKNSKLIGDYALNIYNSESAEFFLKEGINEFTIALEAKLPDVTDILNNMGNHANLVVQGSPAVMYMEHDLYQNLGKEYDGKLILIDSGGYRHPVYKDRKKRNHLLLYKDISLLPVLKELHGAGLSNITIEAAHLEHAELKRVLDIYTSAVNNLNECDKLFGLLCQNKEYSFGALNFLN